MEANNKMTVKYEKTGPVTAELTFTIERSVVEKGLDETYQQVKGNVELPGFRKGRVPRQLFNRRFGEESLYEDTLNSIFPAEFEKALDGIEDTIVGQPTIKDISWDAGKDWEVTVILALEPEVKLGQYKDLEVTKLDRELEEDAVESELERYREEFKELVIKDTAAENGDTVVIDYEGSVDGEVFEGGSATNYSLELGSNSFIPGFEEQLVGAEPGSEVEVKVTFPEEYQAEELAGKEAVFKVTVHEVKEVQLPEVDDEFAQDVDEDVETLDELKEKLQEELQTALNEQMDEVRDEEAIMKAVANAEIEEIPSEMIHEETNRQMEMFYQNLQQNGMNKEMYFQITGTTEEDMHAQFEAGAEESVRTNLVIEAIVDAEELTATEEEQEEEVKRLAEQYNLSAEQIEEVLSPELLARDIAVRKAIELVTESAKEVLEPETEETTED